MSTCPQWCQDEKWQWVTYFESNISVQENTFSYDFLCHTPMGFIFIMQTMLMDTQGCKLICPECFSDFHQALGYWSNQCKQAIKLQ